VEQKLAPLCEDIGLGLTTWSPLASGLLTGKYTEGVPEGSRGALPGYEWLAKSLTDPEANSRVRRFVDIADSLGCSPAQLAIAWCLRNPQVSSVITGATRAEQVRSNLAALDVVPKLTGNVLSQVDGAFATNRTS
jgi:aryl-alcohol dehydrogenase-like predicted oxidoreductase